MLALLFAACCFVASVHAATVGAGGYTNDFTVRPDAADWSTFSIAGASGDVTDAAGLDAAVQAVAAGAINTQVLADAGNPPPFNAFAQWSSTGLYLQTRMTGNKATLLMCTLVNNIGTSAASLHIQYNLTSTVSNTEEVPGQSVYYSLSGNPNQWIPIPALSINTPACCYSINLVADVILASNWDDGTTLFLLFADDNGSGSPDVAYQIDNVFFTATPATPVPIVITNQPSDSSVFIGQSASFMVGASGFPISYQWYKSLAPIAGANGSIFSINTVTNGSAGPYFCVLSNQVSGNVTSRIATLSVLTDTFPPTILSAVSPLAGTSVRVTFSETVTNGGVFTNYVFTVSGTTNRLNKLGVTVTSPSVVTISTTARVPGTSYTLTVNNVKDAAGNSIEPNTQILIATEDTLLAFTNVWRIETNGIDLGTAWRDVSYNDGFWATGAGAMDGKNTGNRLQLGGQPIKTFLPLNSPSFPASNISTYYFRTHFSFPGYTNEAVLHLRHLIDDGAVFYLNGAEIYRFNLQASQPAFDYGAISIVGDAASVGPLDLPVTNLLTGDNVLAVELHQGNATSGDITFGAELVGHSELIPFGPVVITNQPTVLQVTESQPTVFGVEMTGARPRRFQWYSNDVALAGATNELFQIPVTPLNASGSVFRVTITNGLGGSASSNILLSVLADVERPSLLAAKVSSNLDTVLVTFSERMAAATATNINSYRITNQSGQVLLIFGATMVDAFTVRLATSKLLSSERYVLRVTGVRDIAMAANVILPNAGVTIGGAFELVNFDHFDATSFWRFYGVDGVNRPELSPAWKTNDFVEFMNPIYGWEEGYGLIGKTLNANAIPAQINSSPPLDESGNFYALPCYYFRIRFNFGGSPTGAVLQLRHIIDDGAVFYLNGQELSRFHLAAGLVVCGTTASSVSVAPVVGPFTFPTANLVTGTNVLAVEVHQDSVTSGDIVFGAELKIVTASIPLTDHLPRLGIVFTNGEVRLDWTASGYALEQSGAATGAWETVSGVANNIYTTHPTNAARFFRLKQ